MSVFSKIPFLPNGEGERDVPVSSVEVDSKSNAVVSVASLNGNEEGSIDTANLTIDMANLDLDQLTDNILLGTKAATDKLFAEGRKENLKNFQVTHANQATIMENQKVTSEKLDYLLAHATPNGKNYLNRLKKESERKKRASQKKSTVPSSTPVVRGMDKHVKQRSPSTKAKAEAKKRVGRVIA